MNIIRKALAFIHATAKYYKALEPTKVIRTCAFPIQSIAGGNTGYVTVYPQSVFKPFRLVIISPRALIVEDISVGNQSLFIESTGIPAAVFTNDNNLITWPRIPKGKQVCLRVRNEEPIECKSTKLYAYLVGELL